MSHTREGKRILGQHINHTTGRILITFLWLVLGLCSWLWLLPIWIAALRPAPDQIIDHYQDWGAARNYWTGLAIYTPHSVSIPHHLGLAANPVKSIEYNAHPPTSVLLVLPLARLDYPMASLAIVAVVLPLPKTLLAPILTVFPYCLPILGNLQMGQLTIILNFLITLV
jgi:hypothetical protein